MIPLLINSKYNKLKATLVLVLFVALSYKFINNEQRTGEVLLSYVMSTHDGDTAQLQSKLANLRNSGVTTVLLNGKSIKHEEPVLSWEKSIKVKTDTVTFAINPLFAILKATLSFLFICYLLSSITRVARRNELLNAETKNLNDLINIKKERIVELTGQIKSLVFTDEFNESKAKLLELSSVHIKQAEMTNKLTEGRIDDLPESTREAINQLIANKVEYVESILLSSTGKDIEYFKNNLFNIDEVQNSINEQEKLIKDLNHFHKEKCDLADNLTTINTELELSLIHI